MPTIDLPAHNLNAGGTSPATIVGGGEALATTDTGSYVEMLWTGGQNFTVGTGIAGTGFGLATVPDGATVTGVQMVALAYRSGGGDNVPTPGWEEAVSVYPSVAYTYGGDPWPGNYNIGPLPIGTYGEAFSTLPSDQWQFVIAGWPGAPAGFAGLSPAFFVGPSDSGPFPRPALTVRVNYLALRVTYTGGEEPPVAVHAPPLRLFPRSDGRGMSSAQRVWPRPPTTGYGRVGPGSLV